MIVFVIAETLSLFSRSAAYLDPGSGSYIIQLIIAGFMGGLFMLGVYWRRVKSFFKNLFNKEDVSNRNE
ncbi:MAG: hypothetical protein IBX69_07805 [Anaerolineales bacterium]|nr:hypothetical protein [Anaerolineales bacterium]